MAIDWVIRGVTDNGQRKVLWVLTCKERLTCWICMEDDQGTCINNLIRTPIQNQETDIERWSDLYS